MCQYGPHLLKLPLDYTYPYKRECGEFQIKRVAGTSLPLRFPRVCPVDGGVKIALLQAQPGMAGESCGELLGEMMLFGKALGLLH